MSSHCIASLAEVIPQNTILFFDKIINLISLQIFCHYFDFKPLSHYGMVWPCERIYTGQTLNWFILALFKEKKPPLSYGFDRSLSAYCQTAEDLFYQNIVIVAKKKK